MNDIVVKLENISKDFTLYDRNVIDRLKDAFLPGKNPRSRKFTALKNINLEIKQGEILGIIGRNGAGKSTLVNIISEITSPSTGTVFTKGSIVPLLELGGGLNPSYTGKENVYFYCALQGLHKEEIDRRYNDIIEFSELGDFINVPVKKYSRGMKARLAFAVSINIDPDILILDEVLSVGDELFQRKCFLKMEEFFKSGRTVLFISHSMSSIREICSRVILLHKGEIVLSGVPDIVIPRYNELLGSGKLRQVKMLETWKEMENDDSMKSGSPREMDVAKSVPENIRQTAVINENHSFFVSGFDSSMKSTYTKSDILFEDVYIEDSGGTKVNHLVPNRDYLLKLSLHFIEPVKKVRISAELYTARNKILAGYRLPGKDETIPKIHKEETVSVNMPFSAHLADGIYGIKITVLGMHQKQIQPVAVFFDAVVFKVLPDKETQNCVGSLKIFANGNLIKYKEQ